MQGKLLTRSLPCLHPASFAIVMGTGTLACVTLEQAAIFPSLFWVGATFCWLDYFIFLALAPYAFISWSRRGAELASHLEHPADMAFFATIGIGLLVLANQTLQYGLSYYAAFGFWLCGAIVTLVLNLAIFLRSFLKKLNLDDIAPALFIPVVGLLVVPVAGCSLAKSLGGIWAGLVPLVSASCLGAGIMLYVGLFGAMLERHLLLVPLPDHLAPTLWIHLAPLGWGSLGILALGSHIASAETVKTLEFFGLLAWGASSWWVAMALILTIRAIYRKGMYFNMAWWSFIFPLGSFALLSKRLHFVWSAEISFCVWLLMLFIWLLAAYKTARLITGKRVCLI